MKKYIAIFVLALLAVSIVSAAGVVTAQKASASPPRTITVPYEAGKTYTWTSTQFNYHGVSKYTGMQTPVKMPPPLVSASSRGGTAATSAKVVKTSTPNSESGEAAAYVGVLVTVPAPEGGWNGLIPQATIKINGQYAISALAQNSNTYAIVSDSTQQLFKSAYADGSGTAVTDSGPIAFTSYPTPFYYLGSHDADGTYHLYLTVVADSRVVGTGQASGTVSVSSISVTFS